MLVFIVLVTNVFLNMHISRINGNMRVICQRTGYLPSENSHKDFFSSIFTKNNISPHVRNFR